MSWNFYDNTGSRKVAPASVVTVSAQLSTTTGQAFTAGTSAQVLFSTVDWDSYGGVADATNDRFVVPAGGTYLVEVNLSESGQGGAGGGFIFEVNGTLVCLATAYEVGGIGGGLIGHSVLSLSAGDVVTVWFKAGTSGGFTTNTTNEPKAARASITKIDGAVVKYVQTPFTGIGVTSGAISSGPPASPNNGDIWIATDADGASDGVTWMFRYNAGSSSSYKWEFIGGAPIYVENNNVQTISSTSYTSPTDAWTLTVPRGGDYYVHIGGGIGNNTSGDGAKYSYKVGSTAASDSNACTGNYTPNNNAIPTVSTVNYHEGIAAGTVLTEQFRAYNGGAAAHTQCFVELTPIRVS